MNAIKLRIQTIKNPTKAFAEKVFAVAELICFPVSFLTFAFVVVDFIGKLFGLDLYGLIGSAWQRKFLSVLVAAAIGYVTNWLAILMLFRPYEYKRWMFFWPQGLIPRNKPKMAKEIGRQVGLKLLSPDKLVDEFCQKIEGYLSRPDVIKTLTIEMREMLGKHEASIVAFLVPQIERAILKIVDENLTPTKFRQLWDTVLLPRLNDATTRNMIALKIVNAISQNAPELVAEIRIHLRHHLENNMPVPFVADLVMDFFADEQCVRDMIVNWLSRDETHEMFKDKLLALGEQLDAWVKSEDGQRRLTEFISTDFRERARAYVSEFVKDSLPILIGNACASEKLWGFVEGTLLPNAKGRIVGFVMANKQKILDDLRLSERVEDAVNKQSVREFHEMLDRLAAQHLSAIQVLGYVLGGIVGLLQRTA